MKPVFCEDNAGLIAAHFTVCLYASLVDLRTEFSFDEEAEDPLVARETEGFFLEKFDVLFVLRQ